LEEVRRNLGLKYPEALPHFEILAKKCELTASSPAELPVPLKEKDRPILAGAIAGKATHLMTGDQADFGHLFGKTVEGVKVVSPKMLAEELVELGWL
jgi:predicted nucleic acid-binding protein